MNASTLWLAITGNGKTGPIPVSYVGADRAETLATCGDCALRPDQENVKTSCRAFRGRLGWALGRIQKAAKLEPLRYRLAAALANRSIRAKAVRAAVIGNPSGAGVAAVIEQAAMVAAEGLTFLAFDHGWRSGLIDGLKGIVMASCDDFGQAAEASRAGWVPAVIVPRETTGHRVTDGKGNVYRMCPNDLDKAVQCNECRLCTPGAKLWTRGEFLGVAFKESGTRRLELAT